MDERTPPSTPPPSDPAEPDPTHPASGSSDPTSSGRGPSDPTPRESRLSDPTSTDPAEEHAAPRRPPVDLYPRPRVARLNRLVLALVGIGAILILWVALWVLGRRPGGSAPPEPVRAASRPVDLGRLERSAARPQPPPEPLPAPPDFPAPPPPRPRLAGTAPRTDPEAVRAQRALDASPVVPAFQNPGFYPPPTGSEASIGEPARRPKPPLSADLAGASRPADRTDEAGDPQPGHHEAFLEAARRRQRLPTLPAEVAPALPAFTLYEGSYLPAILTAGIHSDLPGQTTALVRENVYDSRTGRHLLVPSGSRLLGSYDHRVAWGQRRALVAWHRLIFPDGTSLDLRGLPGADLAGEAGVRDRVNNHFVRTFGTAILLSAFSAGAQLSQPREASGFGQAPSARQVVAAALGQEINRTATHYLRRDLTRQPTLEIRPGKLFFVQLTADLVFARAYSPAAPAG